MLRTLPFVLAILAFPDSPLAQGRQPVGDPRSAQASAEQEAEQSVVLYDVADLCALISEDGPQGAAEDAHGMSLAELKLLVESRLKVQVDLGQATPEAMRHEIATMGENALVVLGTEAAHAEVTRFLGDLRSFHAQVFDVSFRLITMPADTAAALSFGTDPRFFSDEEEFGALMRGVRENEDRQIMSTPRLLALNGRRANISTLVPVPYVSGYAHHENVAPLGHDMHVPVIDTVAEGVELECRITSGGSNSSITVELMGRFSTVQRPIERLSGPDGDFCQPEVTSRAITTTVIVPDGGRVALPVVVMDGIATLTLIEVDRVLPLPPGTRDETSRTEDPTQRRAGR